MRYTITKNEDGTATLRGDDEQIGEPAASYDAAVAALAEVLTTTVLAEEAPGASLGVLSEGWTSDKGICFAELLAGGRDFSNVVWSWRDPALSLVPLMFQTSTAWGHEGAELAGFIEAFSEAGGTVSASGQFYDSDVGRAAHDALLDGRRFGVSVDPTEAVTAQFICTETDDDGWCVDGITQFDAYEIGGLTMCPFQAFDNASIVLASTSTAEEPMDEEPMEEEEAPAEAALVVVASAGFPLAPPADWFNLPEPQIGVPFQGSTLGDEFLIDQGDGTVACPLTILDSGQWFGHVARWGQCHIADPWGPGVCVTAPESASMYAHFHTGEVVTKEGTRIPVGAMTVGCEHADEHLSAWAAQDHYANAGSGWGNGRMANGEHGVWGCGALRPDVTPAQVAVLRALTLSGDWRRLGGHLELVGALSVNVGGYPIVREVVTASGWSLTASAPMLRSRVDHGQPQSLTAAGIVARCADCQKQQAAGTPRTKPGPSSTDLLSELVTMLAVVERRTRHLIPVEAEAARARIS